MRSVSVGVALLVLAGCGGSSFSEPATASAPAAEAVGAPVAEAAAEAAPAADAPAPAAMAATSAAAAEPSAKPVEAMSANRPAPGQLTAGVWDDNLNFGFFGPYASSFRTSHDASLAMFDPAEMAKARDALARRAPHQELDVQLVLDTTGSMGDELRYLQTEFDSIASTVRQKFPNVTPRWSLVVYRDRGDDYVTRQFDFTTDTARFQANLRAQSADGGGDIPEAVVAAFGVGLKQSWRVQESKVAKIAFWVADAPTHDHEAPALAGLIRDAKQKGVHVYPVASSGVADTAEYQMRAAAQQTGGRYVFLTDDSGVGNSHAEPHIPCYAVTRLNGMLVRMIESELTGDHKRAEPNDVVRMVGKPDADGRCQLANKTLVAAY